MTKLITTILIIGFLVGCARVPKATLTYYPAKWETTATVTQTVGCNKAKNHITVLNTPAISTIYSSDLSKPPYRINIKDLDCIYSDSEITMNFTDDGRLKSINQNTTGQGESIVKSMASLATTVAAIVKLHAEGEKLPLNVEAVCNIIGEWGDNKPVSLTYKAKVDDSKKDQIVKLEPTPDSQALYDQIKDQLPELEVGVSTNSEIQSRPNYEGTQTGVVFLTLQKMGSVNLTFNLKKDDKSSVIDTARIIVPETSTYNVPIPKAALFGTQKFNISLSDAGAVTTIGYTKNTGTVGSLNALGSIANIETPTTKAADLKAQADLIVQQQRLVLCETKPDQCK